MNLSKHSVELPMTGQLSNHFVEGMRKIYELKPFIDIEIIEARQPFSVVKEELLSSTGF